MSRRIAANAPAGDYWASRPITVADDLARLRGPASGKVSLPLVLDWTPHGDYDLDDEQDRCSMDQVVLREASEESQLEEYLNETLLRQLWSTIFLPRLIREEWETQHPSLIG